jgi:NAD(P)-dependent dehydrogenase (short-subunit alcohol dehydrogenase family)
MQSAFITGGNRGIGLGFTKYLLDEGVMVFAGMRDTSSLDIEHKNLHKVEIDVSDDDSIKRAFADVKDHVDSLTYLINNAGLNKSSATNGNKQLVTELNHLDRESMLKMFDVNSVSPMLVLKECMQLLNDDPSYVINISSDRASFHDEYVNSDGNYGYRVSKIALNMLTFCSLYDLPENVRIFAVHPGNIKTDMNPDGTQDAYVHAGKMIGITKNWNEEYNGKYLRFDGSLYPL